MTEEARTHLKTITAIVVGISTITFLCYHPNVAWRMYQGLWVLIGLGVCASIYAGIYTLFEPKYEAAPREDEEDWRVA